jgi:hypothetical protein
MNVTVRSSLPNGYAGLLNHDLPKFIQVGERFASLGRKGDHEGARHPIKCDCVARSFFSLPAKLCLTNDFHRRDRAGAFAAISMGCQDLSSHKGAFQMQKALSEKRVACPLDFSREIALPHGAIGAAAECGLGILRKLPLCTWTYWGDPFLWASSGPAVGEIGTRFLD